MIDKAVTELIRTADDMTHGLYIANQEVYRLLKYGAKVRETPESAPKTVYFIDAENPANNHFPLQRKLPW